MLKVGVYVDAANIDMNGGFQMRYEVLRQFAEQGRDKAMRLNSYATFDPIRAEDTPEYRRKKSAYFSALRRQGFKVIVKNYQWRTNEFGERTAKANADMDMAVDILTQAKHLDRVLLVTGDGDFCKVAAALQNHGVRVEGLAFDNVSGDLVNELDGFTWGQTVPGLVDLSPVDDPKEIYFCGEVESYNEEKKYGFITYRDAPFDPYQSKRVFFHANNSAKGFQWLDGVLCRSSKSLVKFKLIAADSQRHEFQAGNVDIVMERH